MYSGFRGAGRYACVLMATALVAGCSGGGSTGGGGTTNPPVVDNSTLGGWTKDAATIAIKMPLADAARLNATYTRDAALDTNGYQAYSYQPAGGGRKFVALVGQAGSMKVVTALDPGTTTLGYRGGNEYWRADVYTQPLTNAGTYSYSGSYVGLLNQNAAASGEIAVAQRSTGQALITADFTELKVSGAVTGRKVVGGADLPDIALQSTGISASGTFAGTVNRGGVRAGDYAGAFGGAGAKDVGVIMVFNPTGAEGMSEHGMMVSANCTTSTAAACP